MQDRYFISFIRNLINTRQKRQLGDSTPRIITLNLIILSTTETIDVIRVERRGYGRIIGFLIKFVVQDEAVRLNKWLCRISWQGLWGQSPLRQSPVILVWS